MDKNFEEMISDALLEIEMEIGEEFDSKSGKLTDEEWANLQRKIEEKIRALSEKYSGITFSAREKKKLVDMPQNQIKHSPFDENYPLEIPDEDPLKEDIPKVKKDEAPKNDEIPEKKEAPVAKGESPEDIKKSVPRSTPQTPKGKRVAVVKQPQRRVVEKKVKRKRVKRVRGPKRELPQNARGIALLIVFLAVSVLSIATSSVVYFLKDVLYPFNFMSIPVTLEVFIGLTCLNVATAVIVAIGVYKRADNSLGYGITMTVLFALAGGLSCGILFVIGLITLIRRKASVSENVFLGLVIQGFLLGQVLQYVEYFSTGKSFLIDYFFGQYMTQGMPWWLLPLLSVLGAITVVLVAIRVNSLRNSYEDVTSVWYSVVSTILFVACPQVASTVGLVISLVCFIAGSENVISTTPPIYAGLLGAYLVGNGIAWLSYAKDGGVLLVDLFMKKIDFAGFNPFVYIIIASVLNFVTTIITSMLVARFYGETKSTVAISLPFALLQLALPMISAVPLAICTIVFIIVLRNGGDEPLFYAGFFSMIAVVVVVAVLSIVGLTYDESKKDYVVVTNGVQIANRMDEENILLDVSQYSNEISIDTDDSCQSLRLRGGTENKQIVYIKTGAEYIELSNMNARVELVLESNCQLVLSGNTALETKSFVLSEGVNKISIEAPDGACDLCIDSLEIKENKALDLTLDNVSLSGCGTLDLGEGDLTLTTKGEIVLGFGLYANNIAVKIDNSLKITGGEMGISATGSLVLDGEGTLVVNAGSYDNARHDQAGEEGFSAVSAQSLTVLGALDITLVGGNGQNGGNGGDGRNGALGGKGGSGLSVGVISSFSATSKMTLIGGNGGKGGNGGAGGNGGDGGDSGIVTILGIFESFMASGGAGGNAGRGGNGALGGDAGVGLEYTTEPGSDILEKITITNGIAGEKGVDGVDGLPGKVGEGK